MRMIAGFLRGIQRELVTLLLIFLLFWLVLVLSNAFITTSASARPTPLPSDADCTPPAVMMQLQCVTPAP